MERVRKSSPTKETNLEVLRQQYADDICMGKNHDPLHIDCVMCAVNLECSNLQGNTNLKKLLAAKGKRSDHLDTSMAVSINDANAAINHLPISDPAYMKQIKEDIEYSLDTGSTITVKELYDEIKSQCPQASKLHLVMWMPRFYEYAGFTVEGEAVVRRKGGVQC